MKIYHPAWEPCLGPKETEKMFSDNAPAGGDVQLSYEPWLQQPVKTRRKASGQPVDVKDIPHFSQGFIDHC